MTKTYFRDKERNYEPIIKATIINPINKKSAEIEMVIDTGFQGGVLIPLKTYAELGLYLLEEPKIMGITATGTRIELRRAKAILEINGHTIDCTIYTTIGVTRSLLGREVLKTLGLCYKPPEKLLVDI